MTSFHLNDVLLSCTIGFVFVVVFEFIQLHTFEVIQLHSDSELQNDVTNAKK